MKYSAVWAGVFAMQASAFPFVMNDDAVVDHMAKEKRQTPGSAGAKAISRARTNCGGQGPCLVRTRHHTASLSAGSAGRRLHIPLWAASSLRWPQPQAIVLTLVRTLAGLQQNRAIRLELVPFPLNPCDVAMLTDDQILEHTHSPPPARRISAVHAQVSTRLQSKSSSGYGKISLDGTCTDVFGLSHNYLPHDGVAHIADTITGLGEAYGMSVDLAGFLAAFAVAFNGDPVLQSWSIGGPPPLSFTELVAGRPQVGTRANNAIRCD